MAWNRFQQQMGRATAATSAAAADTVPVLQSGTSKAATVAMLRNPGTGLVDAANDAAAASGGVAVGALYRNGSVLMVRMA